MRRLINHFTKDESGAVTVDWVVLTAAIVGLGIVVIGTVSNGALDQAGGLEAHLNAQSVDTY
ncbi:MAG: hypothetical protein COB40_08655 [Marinosulfonomonas sp.]|nr:MAG: hypothetical protein COB40_08655 [Marinosulfonomonas sp.]